MGSDLAMYDEIIPTLHYFQHCAPERLATQLPSAFSIASREFVECLKLKKSPRKVVSAIRSNLRHRQAIRKQREWERAIREDLVGWNPDLIYSNTALNGDVIKSLGLDGIPVLVHVRELAVAMDTLSQEQMQEFRSRPSLYLAVSESVQEYLHKHHGVPMDRIEVVPVGLDCDSIRAKASETSYLEIRDSYLSNSCTDVLIGGLGFLNARKGPDIFVEVAEAVFNEEASADRVRFIWLGEGDLLEPLRAQVGEAGFAERIDFMGLRDNPYPYIQACDFVLMTSRDDPFPRVNLEAAVFERPVICFADSGGSREFAQDDCGIIVSGFDTARMIEETKRLIDDPELRRSLGARAQARVIDKYTNEIVGARVRSLIEDCLNERGGVS